MVGIIELCILGFISMMVAGYGAGIVLAVVRAKQDQDRTGQLNRHDGQVLLPSGRHRPEHIVTRTRLDGTSGTRVAVAGLELSRSMGFRLQALTRAQSESLDARLVIDGTRQPARAARLFACPEVREALATLCGAAAPFRSVNLYPGGDLIVDVGDGPQDDFTERLLRFTSALDDAVSTLERDPTPALGAASGASGSPATFSIEVRG